VKSFKSTVLGQTDIPVGRLGVAASYGAPAEAFEKAFDHERNYFYWGSQCRSGMRQAIQNIYCEVTIIKAEITECIVWFSFGVPLWGRCLRYLIL
jgi:hypothetical protein